MKILLIGSTGQLGTDIRAALEGRYASVVAPTHSELDVCSSEQVRTALERHSPDVVINTSAFHKVEDCESAPQRAFEVNATAVKALAEECERIRATLVHFSTDYVFGLDHDRRVPYAEEDKVEPLNVYGISKAAGESAIQYACSRYYILRLCGLYGRAGSSGKGGNFVENMLKRAQAGNPLRVVDDQILTPTPTRVVAEKTLELLRTEAYGLYHVSADGQCSWYEFTRKIMEYAGVAANVSPVPTSTFPGPVRRPHYSVLSKKKLVSLGIRMPSWDAALSEYIQQRAVLCSAASA